MSASAARLAVAAVGGEELTVGVAVAADALGPALAPGLGAADCDEPSVREIDLNPVVVYPRSDGALALDALMVASS